MPVGARHRSLFSLLFWWRLRHVAAAAYRLVLRRWQAIVLLLLLLSPRDMPVLQQLRVLAYPVLLVTVPGPVATAAVTWLVLLAVALAWAHTQGDVLTGGPAWAHVQVQPLPPALARRVDLAVLAVCDLPLLLPFAAALAVLPAGAPLQRVSQAVAVVVAAAQLPLLQWAAGRRPALAALAVAVQLAGLAALAAGWTPLPFVMAVLLGTLLLWRWADAPAGPRRVRPARAPGRRWALPARAPVWMRLAFVDLRALLHPQRPLRQLPLLACSALPWVVQAVFVAVGVRNEVVTGAVLLTVVPLLFGVSGLAFTLRRLHAPLLALHASMGITAGALRRVDLGMLLVLFLGLATPLVAAAWLHRRSAVVLLVLPLAGLALLACAALNFRSGRNHVLPKLLVCAVAAAASMVLVQP